MSIGSLLFAAITAVIAAQAPPAPSVAITFPGDLELPMKRFDLVFAVDLRAPVIAAKAAVPGMVERGVGAIVNVSSAAALNAYPGQMAYGMAKAALERFTASLAVDLAPHGIAVNTFRIDVPVAGGAERISARVVMTNVPGHFLRGNLPVGMGVRFEAMPRAVFSSLVAWANDRIASLGF